MSKDKEERRLKKVKIAMMRNPMFALWSGVLMVGETSVVDGLPTACTNGRDEMYGREFVKGLNDKELGFLVFHESLHKGLRQISTYGGLAKQNKQLLNMAMDYVINLMAVETDPNETVIAMPRDKKTGKQMGLLDKKYDGWSTPRVFKDLLANPPPQGQGGSGEGGGESGGDVLDEHDFDGAAELSEAEKKELQKEVESAIRQGQIADAKLNGKGGSKMSRELMDLMYPEIDWKEQLREFITATCANKDTSSWRRVNRRLMMINSTPTSQGEQVFMPSLIGEAVGNIIAGADTSGSVNSRQTTKMISEIQNAMVTVAPQRLDMLYWDSYVEKHEIFENGCTSFAETTKPTGGGGTEPKCVIDYAKKKKMEPECIIMLTDGYIGDDEWGTDWPAPVLWVVLDNKGCRNPPVGKVLHVTSEDLS